ncbi:MAG TPA: NFACT family protein [Pyrinomonadaceae bacterium]|jgi:predicted ribosome quality control (RQC) complex YloA/Tae2 family protein|nr:NFACT family protein [Pyrinomonadaceae bacterium]
MNDATLLAITEEMERTLEGRTPGKVFQLSRASLAIDFRTGDGRHLFVAVEPTAPRLYMTARTVRELEKGSLAPSPFVLALRKHLGGAVLQALSKDAGDRIVRFVFEVKDAVGHAEGRTLIAQLSGRSANLFLLDPAGRITDTLRHSRGEHQEIGCIYQPPPRAASEAARDATAQEPAFSRGAFATLSEAADDYYRRLAAARAFDARAATERTRTRQELMKSRKLLRNLESDLAAHGDAADHKRVGDLLLANIVTAERRGSIVRLMDYYADNAPVVEIEVDENRSLQEEAAHRFARFTKAKRAAQELTRRLEEVRREIAAHERRQTEIDRIVAERDEEALAAFTGGAARKKNRTGARSSPSEEKKTEAIPGVRRYRSSDGYEILVGRAARDNDHLTFRVARSYDLWLHSADYPGSHVVVRNLQRDRDVPHRTIIEAAQLAARFSQASEDAKVAVHYTQRKFLSKPKGAAPGLVRMSSFRTLIVEPGENVDRL